MTWTCPPGSTEIRPPPSASTTSPESSATTVAPGVDTTRPTLLIPMTRWERRGNLSYGIPPQHLLPCVTIGMVRIRRLHRYQGRASCCCQCRGIRPFLQVIHLIKALVWKWLIICHFLSIYQYFLGRIMVRWNLSARWPRCCWSAPGGVPASCSSTSASSGSTSLRPLPSPVRRRWGKKKAEKLARLFLNQFFF